MCGIAGIVGSGAEHRRETLERMNAEQGHRGPDGRGVFLSPGVALGHTRLSIIDLSDGGSQPMTHSDAHLTLIFNSSWPAARAAD